MIKSILSKNSIDDAKVRHVYSLINRYKDRFNLTEWKIHLSQEEADDNTLMQLSVYRLRKVAMLRIHSKAWKEPPAEFENTIKHELLHLLLDPIKEEAVYHSDLLPPERKDEYLRRVDDNLEKIVEHLTYIV